MLCELMSTESKKEKVTAQVIKTVISTGSHNGKYLINNDGLVIPDIEIDGYLQFNEGAQNLIKALTFINCDFNDSVYFSNYSNIGLIIFDNCTFHKKVNFTNLQRQIELKNNCHLKEETAFSSNAATSHLLIITDCDIDSHLTISGPFKKSIVIKNINNKKKEKKGELFFNKVITGSVETDEVYFESLNIIEQTEIKSEANFENIHADNFILNGFKIGLIFRLLSSELSTLSIDNISEHREIEVINHQDKFYTALAIAHLTKTTIKECPFIKELRLWGTSIRKDTFFHLEKVELKKLHFDKLFNEGIITLRELKIQQGGLLAINSSNLGRTDFILCDFSKATLEFENSKIIEAFFSETDFPKTVRIANEVNHAQAQLAFGQLHTAFQKQGDTVRALEYQSREIEEHYRKLRWLISKKKPYISFTWLNLWLNKISNNFGRNWFKGIVFSFTVGILFFYLLVLSTKEYHLGFPITLDRNLLIALFRFMNPIRFFELDKLFEQSITLSVSSFIFDLAGRIFVAYGFYQTIQAFRRYGRK